MNDDNELRLLEAARSIAEEDDLLTTALSLADPSLLDATSAEKWDALVKLSWCDKGSIHGTIVREARKIYDWAESERQQARKPKIAKSLAERKRPRGRPLAREPKHTAQQLKALARTFGAFDRSSFPTARSAIGKFLRSPAAAKFGWLKINGKWPEDGTIEKKIQAGNQLRLVPKTRRAYPELASAIWELKSIGLSRAEIAPAIRAIVRLDPSTEIGRRRIAELCNQATLRAYGARSAWAIANGRLSP